jgi:hypothetical protein
VEPDLTISQFPTNQEGNGPDRGLVDFLTQSPRSARCRCRGAWKTEGRGCEQTQPNASAFPKWHDKPKEGINIEESTVHEGFERSDAGKTASWMG